MSPYQYRIIVWIAGEQRMVLCSVSTADMVAEVLRTLCRADNPEYTRIEVELYRPVGGI